MRFKPKSNSSKEIIMYKNCYSNILSGDVVESLVNREELMNILLYLILSKN